MACLSGAHGSPTLIDPAAWRRQGWIRRTHPGAMRSCWDFTEKWTELVKAGSVGNVRLNTIRFAGYPRDERRYTLWLTGLLWRCWAMRQQAAERRFASTRRSLSPLANRARELGRTLVQTEKKPGSASLSLYINGGNVPYGPEDLYTNAFPMRLTTDEPVRIKAYGFLLHRAKGESLHADLSGADRRHDLSRGWTAPQMHAVSGG